MDLDKRGTRLVVQHLQYLGNLDGISVVGGVSVALSAYLLSNDCQNLSIYSSSLRRVAGELKLAALYNLFSCVAFMQPVVILHVSFRATSTCLEWADLHQTG